MVSLSNLAVSQGEHVAYSRALLGGLLRRVGDAKDQQKREVRASLKGWGRYNPVNPNGYAPFVLKDVSTILFLGLSVLTDFFMFCTDFFGWQLQCLSYLADVACVGLMVFGALGSVMNVVVGVLSIIQGARELGKNHKMNGFRLLVEGALTMVVGAFFAGSVLMLREGYLLTRALSAEMKFAEFLLVAVSALVSATCARACVCALPIIYGLQAILASYENIYKIIFLVKGLNLEAQLKGRSYLLMHKEEIATKADTVIELAFSSLGAPLKEELHKEIRNREVRGEVSVSEEIGNSPPSAELSPLSAFEKLAELIQHDRESLGGRDGSHGLQEEALSQLVRLLCMGYEELEGKFGYPIAKKIFSLAQVREMGKASVAAGKGEGPFLWLGDVRTELKRWRKAQWQRFGKRCLHLLAGCLWGLSYLVWGYLPIGARSLLNLLIMYAAFLSLHTNLECKYVRDVPVIFPRVTVDDISYREFVDFRFLEMTMASI